MLRTILIFGLLAGLVVAVPMDLMLALSPGGHASNSMITGYALMLVALSFVFLGVKHYRDRAKGGVIKFLPALGVGLGISVVASMIYVIGWEITISQMHYDFIDSYANSTIERARAHGMAGPELAALTAQMDEMKIQYANPLFRLPMTFIEIFPVGVIVSLITAGLLRNSRFLPARAPVAA